MSESSLELPSISELSHLKVAIAPQDELGVVAVTANAEDGDSVTLTWDEVARSVTIRWMTNGVERVRIERELATKVSILEDRDAVEFRSWIRASDVDGHLLVRVANRVTISDSILRK